MLGARPLVVLTRAHGDYGDGLGIPAAELERIRLDAQRALADLSTAGSQRILDSGHNLHLEAPAEVERAIHDVLDLLREKRAKPVGRTRCSDAAHLTCTRRIARTACSVVCQVLALASLACGGGSETAPSPPSTSFAEYTSAHFVFRHTPLDTSTIAQTAATVESNVGRITASLGVATRCG